MRIYKGEPLSERRKNTPTTILKRKSMSPVHYLKVIRETERGKYTFPKPQKLLLLMFLND